MTENTSGREPGYHPPPFPLFEATFVGESGDPQRWLLGWNGLVDEPALDVTLAARGQGGSALVTSSRWSSDLDARLAAMRLLAVLDGTPEFGSPAALMVSARDDTCWALTSIEVDGHARTAWATTHRALTSAYCTDEDAQLAVAHREAVTLRRVRPGAAGYQADPLTSHSYATLPSQPPLA